ncbi:hypothetical protein HanXRQr2_Chr03g0108551 [Helianthus annuus]|uniref:Uncharacterized protein n=1 Tax=Helianthus annuus TaxID=4232 RepID=A0A251V6K8_HELAN|nr:hypothetical protein HanXRQr2_Chr03g0108551 [Helianthus annuus]KAJ0943465.1 hypothetical protein HanPSC8_Chr03g0105061 [Helianthus annuus]
MFLINTSLRPSSLFQLIQLIHPFLLPCKNKVVHILASLAFAHRKAIHLLYPYLTKKRTLRWNWWSRKRSCEYMDQWLAKFLNVILGTMTGLLT